MYLFTARFHVTGDISSHLQKPQRRNLKSRYGARNRFQELSLELSSHAT